MEGLSAMQGAASLVLELCIGFVLGVCIMRAMPRIVPSRWLIGLSLAGIGVVAIIGTLVYPFHERMLVLVAVLASYVVSGAAFRTEEVRSRHGADQLILLGLALLAVTIAGALLGYSLLAIIGDLGSATILALAVVGAVMMASGFGLIVLFMDRGGRGPVNWRAAVEAARMVDDRDRGTPG
jgi:hypothetical protein